jgi:CBS-domain-containing membrane protein
MDAMRRVTDVMTVDLVAVEPSTPFKELARLLREHELSALPVVDEHQNLVGVVSESDLMLKHEHGERSPGWWRPRERTKARGQTAAELMTAPAVTIEPEASLAQAARVMYRHEVKRLPVVDRRGTLLGIVSRTDLLKVFLRDDREIRDEVEEALFGPPGWAEPGTVRATVQDGVVTIEGQVERRSHVSVVLEIVAAVDGVVGVQSRLGYQVDDLAWGLDALTPWAAFGPRDDEERSRPGVKRSG